MKIVVAIDSFKGSASSIELGEAARRGVLAVRPDADVEVFPIADGGEGTMTALQQGLGGDVVEVPTVDLLGRPITARYLLADDRAFIEAAKVVGIDKITPSPDTIQRATTFGLAALFLDAKRRGVREIVIALGGTGTSDGGLGLLRRLGAGVGSLADFVDLDVTGLERFDGITITALADVTNPYAGPSGFAWVFGPQKGGTDAILAAQDARASLVVGAVRDTLGLDLQAIPGTGAAGGLGGAIAILGGTITPGFPVIARLLGVDSALVSADLAITGEGRMDSQTAQGKVPFGVATLAAPFDVPTIAVCGALADDLGPMDSVLLAVFSIQRAVLPLAEAMKTDRTLRNMERTVRDIIAVRFG